MELKATLTQSQQREKKSGCMVQELTAMVKEQKNRITELIKAKRDAVASLKVLYTDFFPQPPSCIKRKLLYSGKKTDKLDMTSPVYQSLPSQKLFGLCL